MYEKILSITEGVSMEVEGSKVKATGPKGTVERTFLTRGIDIQKSDDNIKVSADSDRKTQRASVGSIAAHIRNMMKGATDGYTYKLRVVFSHFPITVKVEKGKVVIQNFMGERKPRTADIRGNVQVKVDGQDITVTGTDIEEVSGTASRIELATRISGYDKKIFQDGVWLVSRE